MQNDYGRILSCKWPYNEKISTFKQLPEKDNSVSFYATKLWFLAIAMPKVIKSLRLKIFSRLSPLKEQNNFSVQ